MICQDLPTLTPPQPPQLIGKYDIPADLLERSLWSDLFSEPFQDLSDQTTREVTESGCFQRRSEPGRIRRHEQPEPIGELGRDTGEVKKTSWTN